MRAAARSVLLALAIAGAAPPGARAACVAPVGLADASQPTAVVGNGTAASCTEAAFATAVAGGGVVTFACGPDPVTIAIHTAKPITADTVIDGGARVTLDGGGTSRILTVPSSFELGTPTLTVQRLRFVRGSSADTTGDDTERGGGAIWVRGGSLRVVDSTFDDDHGPATGQDVAGGAIYSVGVGTVAIAGSTFTNGSASNGGAIGVLFSDLAIADTTIADNAATGSGGNPGNGGNGGGIYSDGNDQTESLCDVTLSGNTANAFGGGMFRVSNDGVGPMSIERTSVLANSTPDASPAMAGGLYLQGVQIAMRDSTVAWNHARGSGGLFIGPSGTTMDFENVTIAENTALSSLAGGMAISDGVTGTIRNATIARNSAPGPVAFAGATTGGSGVVLANSIVDGNSAGNGWNPISCLSPFVDGAHNLQWPVARAGGGSDVPDALCAASVVVAASALGALQDNGGATLTIRPAADSPAAALGTGCPAADQRGVARNLDVCTAGAVELAPEPSEGLGACAALAALLGASLTRRRRSSPRCTSSGPPTTR